MGEQTVRRRKVFFIHGFDPRSPRTYHRHFATQAARYVERFDVRLDVSPPTPRDDGGADWRVSAEIDGGSVETDYCFLSWGDLASGHLKHGHGRILLDGVWTGWEMLRTGHWQNIWRADVGSAILIAYAHVMAVLVPLLALMGGVFAFCVVSRQGEAVWLALPAGIAAAALIVWLSRRLDRQLYIFHLLTSFTDAVRQARGERPDTEARLDAFADAIATATEAASAYDEVLVAGHSIGAYQALSAAARALRRMPADARLSVATLGQNCPFASFHPAAAQLRRDFAEVAADPRATWVDVSSPRDWLGHILLDVTAPPDVPRLPEMRPPLVISARWTEAFAARTRYRLLLNFFETHFLYMYANDHESAWDWFKVVAGPVRLGERFAGRRPAEQARRMAEPGRYKVTSSP